MSERDCEHGQLARSCEICELIAENKRLKEEAQSAISFAAKTEIEPLRAQLAEKDKEIERLLHIVEDGCQNESGECIWFHYNEKAGAENAELRERLKAVEQSYHLYKFILSAESDMVESRVVNEFLEEVKKAVGK